MSARLWLHARSALARILLVTVLGLTLLGGLSGGVLALPPGVTHDGAHTWTITPHNSSPDDPQRIQAAVNQAKPGDTIRLGAGTFDFSEFETVTIAKDLTIEGQWDAKNQVPLTTIKNGYMPLCIGRKTPVVKPELKTVNGHQVYHITRDVFGRLNYPFTYDPFIYPGGRVYNVFDDWTPVNVTVRQITFVRPYLYAIGSSGARGGTVERVRIQGAWPGQLDIEHTGALAHAISWVGMGLFPLRRTVDPALYTGTDLVRGNLLVQDSTIEGDYRGFSAGDSDESGDVVAVPYDPANPAPPQGAYEKYVLQDVATEWDAQDVSMPESVVRYWVKKGYTASYWDGQVYVDRGVSFGGIHLTWTEAALTVRRNVIRGCFASVLPLANGYRGKPFTAVIEDNSLDSQFFEGVLAHDYPFTNQSPPGEELVPNPGSSIVVKNNKISVRAPLEWGWNAIDLEVGGQVLVEGNRIACNCGAGIGLWWPTQKATVRGNRVSGTGDYGLVTFWGSDGNILVNNDVSAFTPSGPGIPDAAPAAYILLLSDHNTVIGRGARAVLDLGQDNTIIGVPRRIGQAKAAAQGKALAKPYQRMRLR